MGGVAAIGGIKLTDNKIRADDSVIACTDSIQFSKRKSTRHKQSSVTLVSQRCRGRALAEVVVLSSCQKLSSEPIRDAFLVSCGRGRCAGRIEKKGGQITTF